MGNVVFFLLKVFENESFAHEFETGKLFLNRLSYFKKLEENNISNRADRFEGVVGWHQPDKIKLEINGVEITGLASPLALQMNHHDSINIFCMYAGYSSDRKYETKEEMMKTLKSDVFISNELNNLGNYGVLILDIPQFLSKVEMAAIKNNYHLQYGLVDYYDPLTFHGDFDENAAIFKKQDIYKHQREYRLSIESGEHGDHPIILEIGDIRDIVVRINPSELNRSIKFSQ